MDQKNMSDLPADDKPSLPNINKDTGKEAEGSSQCSQELAISSVPEVPENLAPLEQQTPSNMNYNPERGSRKLTSSSVPSIAVKKYAGDLPAEENLPLPKINKDTGKKREVTESGSQDLTNSSVPQGLTDWVPRIEVESFYDRCHDAKPNPRRLQVFLDIENGLLRKKKDTGKELAESGSQESRSLSAPSLTEEEYASDLTAKDSPPPPNINKDTGKEMESSSQCFQELATSSVQEVPESQAPLEQPIPPNTTVKQSTSPLHIDSMEEFPPLGALPKKGRK